MVRYDDLLNGSAAAPAYDAVSASALPTRPADGATDGSRKGGASSRSVLLAWFALAAILVLAHVVTLNVQA